VKKRLQIEDLGSLLAKKKAKREFATHRKSAKKKPFGASIDGHRKRRNEYPARLGKNWLRKCDHPIEN